jgi:hypothetical protein
VVHLAGSDSAGDLSAAMELPMKTYGDLKKAIAAIPRGDFPSRVNPAITRSQALDVFESAIRDIPDDKPIVGLYGYSFEKNVEREAPTRSASAQIELFKTTFYQGYQAARDRPDLTMDEAWAIMLRAPFLSAMAQDPDPLRWCNCSDPENCRHAVPGYACKAGRSV